MAETETKPEVPKTVEDANLDVYARTFEKCLRRAQAIVNALTLELHRERERGGSGLSLGSKDVVEIAEAIFRQFQHDQIELSKQSDIINYIQNLVRNRGGL